MEIAKNREMRFNRIPLHHLKCMSSNRKLISPNERAELIVLLKARFDKNKNRHKEIEWAQVLAKLEANPEKLWSLNEMEITGGEPDLVGIDKKQTLTYFIIVLLKVQKDGEVFATTGQHWTHEKKTNLETMP